MAFTKITDEDRQGKGNVGQPDTPLLSTTEMQEQMDSLANLAIDKFNAHIDELTVPAAANYIGCQVPGGIIANPNIGSVLQSIAVEARQSIAARHTHANKATLDAITAELLTSISNLVLIMSGINSIDTVLSENSATIPTSAAVKNFVDHYDLKAKIRDAIYPVGAVYQTTLISPDSIFGTTGDWTLVSTDENGIKSYKRIR